MLFDKDNNLLEIGFNSFFHDCVFYGSDLLNTKNNRDAYNLANKMYDNKVKLYFEVSKDMSYCEEIITGKKFLNMSEDEEFIKSFYNEETELYILIPKNYNEYPVDLRKMVKTVFNKKYIKDVSHFFEMYKKVKEYDDYLVSKKHLLILKNIERKNS